MYALVSDRVPRNPSTPRLPSVSRFNAAAALLRRDLENRCGRKLINLSWPYITTARLLLVLRAFRLSRNFWSNTSCCFFVSFVSIIQISRRLTVIKDSLT